MTAPMLHAGWSLANSVGVDKEIRERLSRGDRVEAIAEGLGVATGYVEAIALELAGGRPVESHERQVFEHEQLETRSRVHCLIDKQEIGARDCVDHQCSRRCFCPRGTFAINAMAELVTPGSRMLDRLIECRARARAAISSRGHLGPALDVLEGRPIAPVPLFAGELPAAPKKDLLPLLPKMGEKQRAKVREQEAATIERAEEIAELEQTAPPTITITSQVPLAPLVTKLTEAFLANAPEIPRKPKEKPMGKRSSVLDSMTDEEIKRALDANGGHVKATFDKLRCGRLALLKRLKAMGYEKPAHPPPSPRAELAAESKPPAAEPARRATPAKKKPALAREPESGDDEIQAIGALLAAIRALTPAGRAYVADRLARGA